jgi:hypothetical protein
MEEAEEPRQEISKRQIHEPIGSEPLPHGMVDIERMMDDTPKMAPLFVKIEKYKEILESIQKMKLSLKNIQFLMSFREQIKKMDEENDQLIYKTLQALNQSIGEFNANFSIPRGVSYIPKPPTEERVDETVSDLGDKINKLREELEKIRV